MSTNIEMNIMQSNRQYETVYPQTTTENVIGLDTELSNLEDQFTQNLSNYFTKTQTLQSSTASLFNLGTGAIPDNVFEILSQAALYKTVTPTGLYDVSDSLLLKLPGVQIETGSYVGTGTHGSSKPNSLTFGFEPKLVLIQSDNEANTVNNGILPCVVNNANNIGGISYETGYNEAIQPWGVKVKRTNKTVSWYFNGNSHSGPNNQLNSSGLNYYYIAIG